MVDYSNNNINNNKMKKRYHDYIEALEEERKKIQVFHRELPLCLDLVNQAIENCKQQISFSLRSDIEEQTTSTESPVLEEFIPLKRSLSSEEEEEEHQSTKSNDKIGGNKNVDWLKSCQLWNQPPDPPSSKQDLVVTESKKTGGGGGGGGAFHPFKKDKIITTPSPIAPKAVTPTLAPTPVPIPASSSTGDNSNKSREDKDAQRKARRCWSPELHRRFLHALQQLGGSHAATPKQIRELMKVDGLTNDEVKSHLQKYRLHTRRPSQSVQTNGNPQPTQFVVVGGIWVPPQEYSAAGTSGGEVTTAAATPKGFYVPVAAQPQPGLTCSQQQQQQKQLQIQGSSPTGSERRSSHSVGNENTHSDSREVTSSSNTITESLAS